jgi:DNA-binding PadR family transcriptional regulator
VSGSSPRVDLVGLVLRALHLREMCGVDVANLLVDQGLDLSEGSVYAILRGLERTGLAIGVWVDVGIQLPRRRFYRLTPKGETAASRSSAQRRRLVSPALQVGGTGL